MTVKTGMYIVDLSYQDLAGSTFSIAMGQWFAHSSADYEPNATTEIVNAAAFATEAEFVEVRRHTVWSRAQYRAGLHATGAAPTMHIAAQARSRRDHADAALPVGLDGRTLRQGTAPAWCCRIRRAAYADLPTRK